MFVSNIQRRSHLIGLSVLVGVFPRSGHTQETGETEKSRAWSVRLGGGAAFGPDYSGSNYYEFRPVPLVNVKYSDLVFLVG